MFYIREAEHEEEDDNFIESCLTAGGWLLDRLYKNSDVLLGAATFLVCLAMIKSIPVAQTANVPAKKDDNPIDQYEEPYCQADGLCFIREARVFPNRIEYTYKEPINIDAPGALNNPRFGGRPVVYRHEPQRHGLFPNPNAMFNPAGAGHNPFRPNNLNNIPNPNNPGRDANPQDNNLNQRRWRK